MNEAAHGPAIAINVSRASAFDKLRKHLTAPTSTVILEELASATAEVKNAGAKHAAARLSQLDDYATALPPEALPRLVDMDGILDELEDVKSKWPDRLGLFRNIAALIPLLFTWFSLSWATSAYRDEIHQNPDKVYQPFLVLWENGFDRGMWLPFSFVAGVDTALFVALIVATALIHRFEHRTRDDARQLAARVDRAVTGLVAALGEERWLATKNPGDWAAAVQRVIDRAMQETRELNKANQVALDSARLAIQEARQSHTDLIRELGGEVGRTLDAVRAENARLLQQTAVELRDMLTQVFAEQKQIAEESVATVTKARSAIEQSNEHAQATFADLKRESLEALQALHEKDRTFLKETGDLLAGFQSDLDQYRQSASSLADSIGQIGTVAQKLGANTEIFAETAKAMEQHVRSVVDAADATRGAVDHMSSATMQMRDTTMQVHTMLVEVSGNLSPQLQRMGTQVQSASDALAKTQERLADTSESLAQAGKYFRNMPRPRVVFSLFGQPTA